MMTNEAIVFFGVSVCEINPVAAIRVPTAHIIILFG